MKPIRDLTIKEAEWKWTSENDKALEEVKRLVTSSPVLAYYDVRKPLTLQTDASQLGLGAILLQDERPVAYASRAMSAAEQRYAQIEKEALSIAYFLERFHQYTYGRQVIIENDHRPLEAIVKKPLHKAPRRLQNLLLRILNYNTTVTWKPGTKVPIADLLSRAYVDSDENAEDMEVHMIEYLPVNQKRIDSIKTATATDDSLQKLTQVLTKGWPESKMELADELHPYFSYRDELTVQDGIIFRGERILVPKELRAEMKKKVHAGHLGINSCLRRARDLLFWPGMSSDIRQFVEGCHTCASFAAKQPKQPLIISETPDSPWSIVAADLFEIHGRQYLVTVDYYSKFLEVDYLSSLTSQNVIAKLKSQFARHGIPLKLVTDNEPQFASADFASFSKQWCFEHTTSAPGHSQGNCAAEAAVKRAKHVMWKAAAAREDPYLGLLHLRNTPTEDLSLSPAQRLFGRRTRTDVPTKKSLLKPSGEHMSDAHKMDHKKADVGYKSSSRRELKPLQVGNTVTVQPFGRHQSWIPAVVTEVHGRRTYSVQTEGGILRRNRKHASPLAISKHTGSQH